MLFTTNKHLHCNSYTINVTYWKNLLQEYDLLPLKADVNQMLRISWFNIQHFKYITWMQIVMKSFLLQYLETGDVDPLLISLPLSFSSSGTEVIPSLLDEASNGLKQWRYYKGPSSSPRYMENSPSSSTIIIGVGGNHVRRKKREKMGGFKQREGTCLKKTGNLEWQCCFKFLICMG